VSQLKGYKLKQAFTENGFEPKAVIGIGCVAENGLGLKSGFTFPNLLF